MIWANITWLWCSEHDDDTTDDTTDDLSVHTTPSMHTYIAQTTCMTYMTYIAPRTSEP